MGYPKVISTFTVTIETTDHDSPDTVAFKARQVSAINAALLSVAKTDGLVQRIVTETAPPYDDSLPTFIPSDS
jgi:hypothetical protein